MKHFRYVMAYLLLCVCGVVHVCAQDSIRFSLLTCAPGNEIYAHFGHTAIRYENYTRKVDIVFNYGMFNFGDPHFLWRFVKGDTDYQLGVTPYAYFEAEYAMRGSSVYQQVLNLTQEEKERLFSLLEVNYRPENRVYRYNYFYDNCTTRARDRIEDAIQGQVVYPDSLPGKTFRSIVHEFTRNAAWDELGIDFCLGIKADRPIGSRLQMFAPFYMLHYADGAYIVNRKGEERPLVLGKTEKIVDVLPILAEPGFPLPPVWCGILFFVLCVCLAWVQWRHRVVWWGWDAFLFGLQGLAGCVIAFLFFFSSHPTVDSNWLLWIFNPIPLFYLPFLVCRERKGKTDHYHLVNLVYLTLFIVIFFICGQEFNLTILPLTLGLLVTSAGRILVWNKKR